MQTWVPYDLQTRQTERFRACNPFFLGAKDMYVCLPKLVSIRYEIMLTNKLKENRWIGKG